MILAKKMETSLTELLKDPTKSRGFEVSEHKPETSANRTLKFEYIKVSPTAKG